MWTKEMIKETWALRDKIVNRRNPQERLKKSINDFIDRHMNDLVDYHDLIDEHLP